MAGDKKTNNIARLATILTGAFVCLLNQFLISPMLPVIMKQYGITADEVQWMTTGFTMVCALMIPMMAFLADRFSIRKLFITGMALFAAGSFVMSCGLPYGFILAGRLLQAVGAGVMVPIAQVVLLQSFSRENRGTAMGMMALVIAFAPALGPVISGIAVDHLGWHWVFRVVAAASALVVLASFFTIDKEEENRQLRMDMLSVFYSCLGVGGTLYGLSDIAGKGSASVLSVCLLIAGIVSMILFIRRQNKLEIPFLDIGIMNIHVFRKGTILTMIANACLAGGTVLIPIYVQNICGFNATTSGLIMAPGAVMMGLLGPITGRIFDKKGPKKLNTVGFLLLTLGNLGFCFLEKNWSAVWIGFLYTLRMMGVSMTNSPLMTWSMNSIQDEKAAHVVSLFNTLRQISGAFGTALMVIVLRIAEHSGGNTEEATIYGIGMAFWLTVAAGVTALIMVIKEKEAVSETNGGN